MCVCVCVEDWRCTVDRSPTLGESEGGKETTDLDYKRENCFGWSPLNPLLSGFWRRLKKAKTKKPKNAFIGKCFFGGCFCVFALQVLSPRNDLASSVTGSNPGQASLPPPPPHNAFLLR